MPSLYSTHGEPFIPEIPAEVGAGEARWAVETARRVIAEFHAAAGRQLRTGCEPPFILAVAVALVDALRYELTSRSSRS
jgi:hypothetical protein